MRTASLLLSLLCFCIVIVSFDAKTIPRIGSSSSLTSEATTSVEHGTEVVADTNRELGKRKVGNNKTKTKNNKNKTKTKNNKNKMKNTKKNKMKNMNMKNKNLFKERKAPSAKAFYRKMVRKIAKRISDPAEFQKPGSPARKALNWMLRNDPRSVKAEEIDEIQNRYILSLLYFAGNGDDWYECSKNSKQSPCSAQRFLSDAPACEWYGVSCEESTSDDSGNTPQRTSNKPKSNKPISIAFYGNNLGGGKLPSTEIAAMANLDTLILEEGSFSGQIPAEIAQATDLKVLQLSDNELSGPLPEFLSQLTLLEILALNENRFRGTIHLSYSALSFLEAFIISDNLLSGSIPAFLGDLTRLTTLSFFNNLFSGTVPPELGSLTALESLFLHSNNLTGTMPQEICDLFRTGQLSFLSADCAGDDPKIECDCCNACF